MSSKSLLAPFLAVALLGSTLPALAAEDMTPRPQRTFTEKPRIEDYADYNAFLVDIMEFRRQKAERARAKEALAALEAAGGPVSDDTLANVAGQDRADLSGLYRVTGPESIDEALARARKLPHPVYDEPERYGRTTSYSFPIPQMEGDDMSAREIPGMLQEEAAEELVTYKVKTHDELVDEILSEDDPTNSDEEAAKDADYTYGEATEPTIDLATRWVTDSDGNKYWIPIIIENEIGTTIIRKFILEISTYEN